MKKSKKISIGLATVLILAGAVFASNNPFVSAENESNNKENLNTSQKAIQPSSENQDLEKKLSVRVALQNYQSAEEFNKDLAPEGTVFSDEAIFQADTHEDGDRGWSIDPLRRPPQDEYTENEAGEKVILFKAEDAASFAEIKAAFAQKSRK